MKQGFFTRAELPTLSSHDATLVPACGKCGLYKTCNSPKMQPSGKGRKKVLIIAEAPGAEEDRQGVQLVGNTGQDLEKRLLRLGFDMRKDAVLTNALICRPPDNKIKDAKAVSYCRPNLIKTLKEVQPEVVIPLGGTAIESLIKYTWGQDPGAVARWVGYCIPDRKLNAWIVPNFHPSYLLHDSSKKVAELMFTKALEKAVSKVGKGRPHDKLREPDIELIFSPGEASDVIFDMTRNGGVFAFDYETNMRKSHSKESEIVCCSISNGERTIVFPWTTLTSETMLGFFKDKDCKKIASNMLMEDGWSRIFGCVPRGWFLDTMLAAHVMENANKVRNISGLKFQTYVHLGYPDYASGMERYLYTKDRNGYAKNRIRQADKRQLYHYCGLDSFYEWHLGRFQCRKLGKPWPGEED